MKSSLRACAFAISLLGSLALPSPAQAQDIAAAEALFNRGMADLEAGRYASACKAIAESQRLDPRPGTLFTLATCEERWGHIATAVTRYGDYLLLFERLPEDRKAAQGDRPRVAKAQREKLSREVPRLTLSLPKAAPAGTVVKRDGEVVAEAALGVAIPVDPGEHTLSVQPPGGPAQEQRFTIGKGENKVVTLELKATPAVDPPPAPKPASRGRSYVGPIVAFSAAAVGLGVGIGAGIVVLGKRADLDEACPNRSCPASQQGNLDGAKSLSHASTAAFVLAGVGAAVGTVLLFLPARRGDQQPKVGARVGAGYLGIEGTF